ncbi:MAG: HAMP domain-containing sensor histidine kinase [Candidatus Paceibacterota bacterium]|jgi:signal transduction histidine kinase
MVNNFNCPGDLSLFGTFDLSYAPTLLFYSYIPIIFISLALALFILIKDQFSLQSKLLLGLSLSFSVWVINIILQWITVPAYLNYFEWQITPFFEILIPIFSVYFVYVFLEKRDIEIWAKAFLAMITLSVFVLSPTKFNSISFDVLNCQANLGPLLYCIYIFEFISSIAILLYGVIKTASKKLAEEEKSQIRLLTSGASIFLVIFSLSNMFGETFNTYSINLFGPIGMVLFIGLLGYMIVRFKAFNVKLIATQAFMFALIAMIGAQLFFIKIAINFLLTGFTLAASVIVGGLLIRSVEREVAQREEIESLAKNLAKSNDKLFTVNEQLKELNKQKTEFVSIASHQLRSPLTAIKGYASMLLEGSFGPVEDKARGAIDVIFESSLRLVTVIEDFLNITRIELGKMKYEISVFDLGQLAQTVVKDQEPNVKKRGLTIEFQDGTGNHQISADSGKVTQVVSNIVDNSIKYTPPSTDAEDKQAGWIKVKVENLPAGRSKTKENVRLTVSDSGIGIDPATLTKLFDKFVRADDAGKTNISGTGLGLYVAKQIVEGLGGKIWAESEGKGKGSTFIVEFPRSSGEVTKTKSQVESYTKTDLPTLSKVEGKTLQNGKK